jgi:RNA polymerase sigma factor (TIGR02999 family)
MDEAQLFEALTQATRGDRSALDRLFPVVYQELKRRAAAYLKSERAGHTLQPTALVNEVYLRLAGRRESSWQNRAHFMGVAATAMRAVLVDHARARNAKKRGGGQPAIPDTLVPLEDTAVPLEDLDRAIDDLAKLSPRQARVVELRYFGGLSIDETGEALGVSPMTIKRDWVTARAWLFRELSGADS